MIRTVILGLVVASTAFAQTEITPYVSLSGGYGYLATADLAENGTHIGEMGFDGAGVFEGAVGLKFDQGLDTTPLRAELAAFYQQNDVSDLTLGGVSLPSDGAKVEVFSAMLNGYLDMPLGKGFTPYVSVGLGMVNVKNAQGADTESDALFTGQVGGGIGYALTKNIILDLKYRFFLAEDYEETDGADTYIMDISGHQAQLGIRYEF